MKKSEIICAVLREVAAETEVTNETILSPSTCCEVVDARNLAINLLYAKGIYPAQLAKLFNKTRRGICYAISSFDTRLASNKLLELSYKRVKNKINKALDEHGELV